VKELAAGIWRWTARHPEWHPPTDFGAEVASYLVHHAGATVLVDPLIEDLAALDGLIVGDVVVAITIPYHVRSAVAAVDRWGGVVLGHPALRKRLPDAVRFQEAVPGEALPGGVRAHDIKRTNERPLELPGVRALALGDRIVGTDDGLRFWMQRAATDERRRWYRDVAVPLLEPLTQLDVERVLVTHGPPVLRDGRRALADALAAEPWYHRPS
jgi:hypothetical protein